MTLNTVELRPRSVGEVLGLTFDLYRKNFPQFVGIAAVVVVPTLILASLSQILSLVVFAASPGMLTGNLTSTPETFTGVALAAYIGSICFGLLIYIAGIFWPWMDGALTHHVIERVLGRGSGLRASYNETRARFGSLWGSNMLAQLGINAVWFVAYIGLIVVVVIAGVGASAASSGSGDATDGTVVALLALLCMPVLLIGLVVAILLAINWSLRTPVIVGEGVDGVKALSRSAELAKGDRLRLLGRYLLLSLLLFAVVGVPALVLMGIVFAVSIPAFSSIEAGIFDQSFMPALIAISVLALALSFVSTLLITPLYSIFTAVNYLDLRIRKENLAASLMAAPMPVTEPGNATTPAMTTPVVAPVVVATPTVAQPDPNQPAQAPSAVDIQSLPPGQRIGALFNRLRSEGDNPQTLNDLGMAYMDIGDYSGALETLTRARTLAPNDADIAFNLMEVQRNRKDLRAAKQMMGEYLRLEDNPDDLAAVRNNPRYKDLID